MSDLPRGWEWTTIGEVADTSLGKMLDKKRATGLHPTPYLRNINVRWGSFDISDLAEMDIRPDELDRVLAQPGDVIACEGGEPGRAAVWRGPGQVALQKALHRIRPSGAVLPGYLALLLQHLATSRKLDPLLTGTTIKHLPQEKLRRVSVPLPPRAEQERIVAALDEHLSRIDAADTAVVAAERRVRTLTWRALRQVLEQEAQWPETRIGDVAQLSLGKMLDKKQRTGIHPTRYLRNINVRWGEFNLDDLASMDIKPTELERVSVQSGDVVMCEGGEPGRCAVWRGDGAIAIQKALHRIRPSEVVLPDFLVLNFMQMAASGDLDRYFTGTTIKHLPKERLADIRIRLPSIHVQAEAVQRAEVTQSASNRLSQATLVTRRRSRVLRRSILASAFAGRLVPQDPDDEPASLLLERIRAEQAAVPPTQRTRKAKTS